MQKNRKTLWLALALLVAAALMAGAYALLQPQGQAGAKRITARIVGADGAVREHALETETAFLRGALEERGLIAGEESEYGLFVQTVDGYAAVPPGT